MSDYSSFKSECNQDIRSTNEYRPTINIGQRSSLIPNRKRTQNRVNHDPSSINSRDQSSSSGYSGRTISSHGQSSSSGYSTDHGFKQEDQGRNFSQSTGGRFGFYGGTRPESKFSIFQYPSYVNYPNTIIIHSYYHGAGGVGV